MTTVDFGHDWLLHDGRRALLCWHRHSGELVLYPPSGRSVVLTTILDEDEVRRRLDGWEFHSGSSSAFMWLAGQLNGAR